MAGSAKPWRNQQRTCCFRNLCESIRLIKLIDEYGTYWYIKQWGQLSVTWHQTVLIAMEHWALCYQNSWTYEELEDKQLFDEAIDKMGTVPCANVGADEMGHVNIENIEQQLLTVIRGCRIIYLWYTGYHQVGKVRKLQG